MPPIHCLRPFPLPSQPVYGTTTMPPLKMHALPPMARAALAAGLAAALACGWIDPAQAQRKAVKWVVTCPAPRAAAKVDSAPATALAVPDPMERLVEGLGPSMAATGRLAAVPTAAATEARNSATLTVAPAGAAVPVTTLALTTKPAQAPEPAAAPSSEAPPRPVFLLASVPRWEVFTSDVTVSKTLARWVQDMGYRLQWDASRNFQIDGPTGFSADFETAVTELLDTPGIHFSEYPLEACLYANSPPLLRVTRKGEQARECPAVTRGATRTANLP